MPIYMSEPDTPEGLWQRGALIKVKISVPVKQKLLLESQDKPVPSPKIGNALIDTGANFSGIDENVAKSLSLERTRTEKIYTLDNSVDRHVCLCEFNIMGGDYPEYKNCFEVAENNFSKIDYDIIALIGRDILANFVFKYYGLLGRFTLEK